MKKFVYVIGDGQLSLMLFQAGSILGIPVIPISLNNKQKQFNIIPNRNNIITIEIENWKNTQYIQTICENNTFINCNILPLISDRLNQKKLINQLKLPTSPWIEINRCCHWKEIFYTLGEDIILKKRTGGYNGKNQYQISFENQKNFDLNLYKNYIAEKKIKFIEEMSLIGARNKSGKIVFYPITFNFHEKGILKCSIPDINNRYALQNKAELILSHFMTSKNYIGVVAMEFFVLKNNQIIINEISPRVHNSGHWTQDGASINQFELHLRSILDLPIPTPKINCLSVMINIIGENINIDWLNDSLLCLHWYNKNISKYRKVGHINLVSNSYNELKNSIKNLEKKLLNQYDISFSWLIKKLRYMK
ncbi:MAG: 5-(carboxyamino)imidazole ribonucleotide synthase [Wigglesworthia glossinidia]|nr:5-(carboxyamino)imidazole ribonucleotide synthase [Wigglesworthia glossinidia]